MAHLHQPTNKMWAGTVLVWIAPITAPVMLLLLLLLMLASGRICRLTRVS